MEKLLIFLRDSLSSPGVTWWGQEIADSRFKYPKNSNPCDCWGWNGRVIFALYSDSSFNNRLADTGWVNWEMANLIGTSTGRHLDDRENEINDILDTKYSGRINGVYASLLDSSPIIISR